MDKASFLSRLGSGSACRSIYGPLAIWGNHQDIKNSSDLSDLLPDIPVHDETIINKVVKIKILFLILFSKYFQKY